jgi:hypothetical protein
VRFVWNETVVPEAEGSLARKKLLMADIKKSVRRLQNTQRELCSERKSG